MKTKRKVDSKSSRYSGSFHHIHIMVGFCQDWIRSTYKLRASPSTNIMACSDQEMNHVNSVRLT